ncbi:MAG: hypothetical protein IPF51_02260 [Dehalococcoidia bacterium]|uniref:hypothetical protein n=1 Tax=Candidatus Amarobacter glycogenicus TaxID=3140699 RepID=UPI0031370B42|nr:hypothetical protein [Dehalococcoidia bacterium]
MASPKSTLPEFGDRGDVVDPGHASAEDQRRAGRGETVEVADVALDLRGAREVRRHESLDHRHWNLVAGGDHGTEVMEGRAAFDEADIEAGGRRRDAHAGRSHTRDGIAVRHAKAFAGCFARAVKTLADAHDEGFAT